MKEIVVASSNKGKIAEIKAALINLPITVLALKDFGDIPEAVETGTTFNENAILKARHYAHYTGKACLADDSGLEVDALNGAPGVYSARYAGEGASDQDNNKKLLKEVKKISSAKRTARFHCVLAFIDTDKTIMTSNGVCEGILLDAARGVDGFGYDPLFLIPELNKTLAEVSMQVKNSISHRGQALRNMAKQLAGYLK